MYEPSSIEPDLIQGQDHHPIQSPRAKIAMPMTMTPPTTPPAIAPTGVECVAVMIGLGGIVVGRLDDEDDDEVVVDEDPLCEVSVPELGMMVI